MLGSRTRSRILRWEVDESREVKPRFTNMQVIPATSKQADEVAWEHSSAGDPTSIIKKDARPPAILRGGGDGDNIPGLEVELFVDCSTIVIQSAD